MACVTLKRSLDFDPLHVSPKRRRYSPLQRTAVKVQPATCGVASSASPFVSAAPSISSEAIAAKISAEVKRLHRRKQLSSSSDTSQHVGNRNCLLVASSSTEVSNDSMESSGETTPERQTSSPNMVSPPMQSGSVSPDRKDVPLFTFRQVNLLCERLVKEREQVIREHYEKVLSDKLSEQYEAFLKFNHDMLQRRFSGSTPSYVS